MLAFNNDANMCNGSSPIAGPPKTKIIWVTPVSRTSSSSPQTMPLRTRLKILVREATPPFLYKAAHGLWQRYAVATSERGNSSKSRPIVSTLLDRPNLAYRHTLALQERVSELKAFAFDLTADNAEAILEFYNSYIPLIREEARGAFQRTLLARLRRAAPDTAVQASKLIARLDLADGLPDRSQRLIDDPASLEELRRQTEAFEKAYGARIVTERWGSPSRGSSLLHYFSHHRDLVAGKDVLHVAPENELRSWLRSNARRYVVLDGVPDKGTDIGADVTAIPLPDATFDFILCHRVLEHVLDDIGALRELRRILKPGGTLNLSVPQAVHRQHTAEWLVPDESHHWHVRQYGEDLTKKLESVGFAVELVRWLCERPRDELLAIGAYPLRIYAATRTE
jgi:SAM-dependent methyltransferase